MGYLNVTLLIRYNWSCPSNAQGETTSYKTFNIQQNGSIKLYLWSIYWCEVTTYLFLTVAPLLRWAKSVNILYEYQIIL